MRLPLLTAAILAATSLPALADHCPADKMSAWADTVKSDGTIVAYRTTPPVIAVGKPFSIEVVACLGSDNEAPQRIRVDAGMPMHGHGMNYKPSERKLGPGHSAFDGMLFHMPGNWQLTFDVYDGEKRQRLTRKVVIGR